MDNLIKFTEAAKSEILKTLNSPQIPEGYALRVGLKGGACSTSYLLGLDKASEHDEIHEIEGVKVLIDRRHLMYLIGVQIGFEQTDEGLGFTIVKGDGF
jgi:iron-sulfur cluster assembly protein